MSTLTEHAKIILLALVEGKRVKGVLADCEYTTEQVLSCIANGFANNLCVMPETRNINGVVFNAPSEGGHYPIQLFADSYSLISKWSFATAEDRNAATVAILDALSGVTK